MNQTRSFLVLILLFVSYLLWTQWQNDYHRRLPPAPAATASAEAPAATASVDATAAIPSATPAPASSAAKSPAAPPSAPGSAAMPHGQQVVVSTDVLRLTIDTRGGTVLKAELLKYPETLKSKASVSVLNDTPTHLFLAQSGLVSASGAAPDHRALFRAAKTRYALQPGQKTLSVPLTWTGPDGVTVTKTFTLTRGSYQVRMDQRIDNGGAKAWVGNAYRQLQRVTPPEPKHSNFLARYSDQSRYSFFGAAWYSPEEKFEKLAFDKFQKDPLKRDVTGGWVAMVQHYFLGAWVPPANEKDQLATTVVNGAGGVPHYIIRAVGPQLSVAPGKSADTHASLYVGPKIADDLVAVTPTLKLAVDYGMFTIVAVPLHWVLDQAHALTGNWGVAIILMVLLINLALYKLSAAQYKSSAKMRKLKPRMDQLKERYGDDKQKMQQAMMELYKKEKINPASGCLPLLVQIPVFFALYVVLRESVELRQAPFVGWIHDLSVADPYFVLPIVNMLVMLAQQFLMPQTPGMDPTQQKMMRFMPIIFSVLFAFFPAGLVLYYVVNGLWRLGQQWWVTRQVDQAAARTKKA